MSNILYYCHACGLRLSTVEAGTALSLGEDTQTACCEPCARKGLRISAASENPVAVAVVDGRVRVSPAEGMKTLGSGARHTSVQNRKSAPATEPRRAERTERSERPRATGTLPLIPFLSGMVVVGLCAVIALWASKPKAEANSAPKSVPNQAVIEPRRNEVVPQGAPNVLLVRTPEKTPPAAFPESRPAPRSAEAPVRAPQSAPNDEAESQTALIESLLLQRSFPRAEDRIANLEKSPAASVLAEKISAWRARAQDGSKLLLDEMLRVAEQRAEAGDTKGVQAALGPRPLQDLLPDHAALALRKAAELADAAAMRAKVVQEKRDGDLAALRANFEATLPAESDLGPPLGGKVLFGPGLMAGVTTTAGQDTIRAVAGRAAYADGSKKIVFDSPSGLGMIQSGNDVGIEYTAVQDVQVYVRVSGGEKEVGGTVTLPAGKLQRKTIAIDNKRLSSDGLKLNYSGHWAGRSFRQVQLEFKSLPAGAIAVFRVSVK